MASTVRIDLTGPVRLKDWIARTDLSRTENIRLQNASQFNFYRHGVRNNLKFHGRIRCKKGRPVFYSKSLTDQVLNGWVKSVYAIRHGQDGRKCDYELAVFVPHGYKKCRIPDQTFREAWNDAHRARIKNGRPVYDTIDELPF